MKNQRTIVWLLVACLLLFGAIVANELLNGSVIDRGRSELLLPITLEDVSDIVLENESGDRMEFKRGLDNEWLMKEPVAASANGPEIARLLDALEQARSLDEIDRDEMALRDISLSDFGVDGRKGRLVLTSSQRNELELKIGTLSSVTGSLFVSLGSSIFVTDPALQGFFKKSVEDFSDMSLFRNNSHRANVITLSRGVHGFVKLIRDLGTRDWSITQPLQARADQKAVEHLLQVLYSSRIDHYAENESPSDTMHFRGYGLDGTDAIVIQVATKDDPAGQGVTVGTALPGPSDQVYVRVGSDGIVGVVTGEVRRVALQTISELRDKSLFTFRTPPTVQSLSIEAGTASLAFRRTSQNTFSITAPVAEEASSTAVSDLLNSIFSLSATRFVDLDKATLRTQPEATFSVRTEKRKYKFVLFHVPEDALAEGEEEAFHVIPAESLSDGPSSIVTVPVVRSSDLRPILAAVAEPCSFVSKTVLALDPRNIRRITSIGGGATSIVQRTEHAWEAVSSTNRPVERSIREWLKTLGELEAASVVALSTGNDCVYSLEPPLRTLIFELLDGESPRVVLLLGDRSPDGGVFGRILGHDVIFTLPETVEDVLVRPLVAPPASMEEGADLPVVELSPPSAKVN